MKKKFEIKCSKCGKVFITNDELAHEIFLENLGVWCDNCVEIFDILNAVNN